MTEVPSAQPIKLKNLTVTWRTLRDMRENYPPGSTGHSSLIDAARWVEIEVRAQHGDEAWTLLTKMDDPGKQDNPSSP